MHCTCTVLVVCTVLYIVLYLRLRIFTIKVPVLSKGFFSIRVSSRSSLVARRSSFVVMVKLYTVLYCNLMVVHPPHAHPTQARRLDDSNLRSEEGKEHENWTVYANPNSSWLVGWLVDQKTVRPVQYVYMFLVSRTDDRIWTTWKIL
jgi:hypothetical protein